ncbi:hypothetical protein Nizo2494_0633 [Lactiplantibacillus plantarum]|nr:hypothetical protein Nizo2457_1085 [Lactiplantibacillus plantarum]KZU31498.1 hypothetical protein Nizo2494_0633 [Lactiplantibacillus plantarum]
MNTKDWQAIKDDWKRVNIDLFGNEYPFVPNGGEYHGENG